MQSVMHLALSLCMMDKCCVASSIDALACEALHVSLYVLCMSSQAYLQSSHEAANLHVADAFVAQQPCTLCAIDSASG